MAKVIPSVLTKKNKMGSRFLNSFGAIFTGLGMIIICLIALGCNERRSVMAIRAYDEVGKNLIETGSARVDSGNDGRLVAIRGELSFSNIIDPVYQLTANSFALKRNVEMFQWKETRQGSSTDENVTYTYTGVWHGWPTINSSSFEDKSKVNNRWPEDEQFQGRSFYAADARLGDFRITPEQLDDLPVRVDLAIPDGLPLPSGLSRSSDKKFLHTGNLSDPEIGDMRVSFLYSDVTRASMLGKQQGDAIVSYTTKNGTRIDQMFSGEISGADMVARLQSAASALTWVLRILLTILVCAGFSMFLSPVQLVVSIIPFLGKYLGKATSFIASVLGGIVGISLSLLIIAISWIAVRPLVAIPLLLVTAGLIVFLNRYRKTKVVEAPATGPAAGE